jgi:hypothetical protein
MFDRYHIPPEVTPGIEQFDHQRYMAVLTIFERSCAD